MGVAFQPGDPLRGLRGRQGGRAAALRQDLDAGAAARRASRRRTSRASPSPGAQALVAAGADLLVNDGSGWQRRRGRPRAVRHAPGRGPAVRRRRRPAGRRRGRRRAGRRDRARRSRPRRGASRPSRCSASRRSRSPRSASGGAVRALAAVQPQLPYPVPDVLPEPRPGLAAAARPAVPAPRRRLPRARDRHAAGATSSAPRSRARPPTGPLKSDPIGALLVDGNGEGWALGGWSGESDAAGRGNGNRSSQGRVDRTRVQTAAVERYATGAQPAQPPALARTGVDLTRDVARFAVAGHAAVRRPPAPTCATSRSARTARCARAKQLAGELSTPAGRPARCCSTPAGAWRPRQTLDRARGRALRRSCCSRAPAAYAAPSAADTASGDAAAFSGAFAGAPAPFGCGAAPAGVTPARGSHAAGARRTHALRVRLGGLRRHRAGDRDRQLARLAAGLGPATRTRPSRSCRG